ncbi:unnamed protein product [Pieris brassicae]|uniref:Uncharacterized protein n=1 Tax=Pieris brassicae TaxID=7116 RepID=A0A9P0XBZ7_PIEBR|nr:unnamed protein product [Pieris brassicae]
MNSSNACFIGYHHLQLKYSDSSQKELEKFELMKERGWELQYMWFSIVLKSSCYAVRNGIAHNWRIAMSL